MARLRQQALTIFLMMGGLLCPLLSHAVGTAPRISDREIIESLAELKAGQKDLQRQTDQLRQEMNQHFESVNQRFDDMTRSIDGRFDDMNRRIDGRFDDINGRLDDLMALMQILIGVLVAVFGGLLTWLAVIWRRPVRLEAQTNEINFLKERFTQVQGMVTQLMAKLP
jgi:FtsZ-binding cell division protein ZapB